MPQGMSDKSDLENMAIDVKISKGKFRATKIEILSAKKSV